MIKGIASTNVKLAELYNSVELKKRPEFVEPESKSEDDKETSESEN